MRVLLVEDDLTAARSLALILRSVNPLSRLRERGLGSRLVVADLAAGGPAGVLFGISLGGLVDQRLHLF